MLYWAAVFLLISIIAAALGFGGIAGAAAAIAKILFGIFLVLFILFLIGAVSFELRLTGITFSNVEPFSMKYRRWVVPGCYGAAREERLANWSAGGRVPDVREVDFTAG